MTSLPPEITDRFGLFRAAWRLADEEGYITHEWVVGSSWYIYWIYLKGRWEYLPFGTSEGEVERIPWRPLFGDIEAVATAIGNSRKLWLVVEKEAVGVSDEKWWWIIYGEVVGGFISYWPAELKDPFLSRGTHTR
jgi:hypothetical protein